MASSYTPLLGLALPVTGELTGTWGDTVNAFLTTYLDAAIAGEQVVSGPQTSVVLSRATGANLVQVGAVANTGSSQYALLRFTGTPATAVSVVAPNTSKIYVVTNSTATSKNVVLSGPGPMTGVTIVPGESAMVAWIGMDFVKVASNVAAPVTSLTNVTSTNTTLAGNTDNTGRFYSSVVTIATGVSTVDTSLGNYFTTTVNGNITFSFTNPPTNKSYAFTLEVNHTSGTISWPTSVVWANNNAAPALTAGRVHLFVFVTDDTGTKWRGGALSNYTS